MVEQSNDLVPGWETLLVAALSKGREVHGVVRLNKVLARLQRRGFPVPIEFRIAPMGPASLDVEERTDHAIEEGLLESKETPMGPSYNNRKDWKLSEEGFEYVKEEVVPHLGQRPNGARLLDLLQDELREMKHKTGRALKEESHEALVLDDPDLFQERYEALVENLREWERYFSEERTPRSDTELGAAAAVELALAALEENQAGALEGFYPSTGLRHVFWNAERLVDILEEFRAEAQLDSTHLDSEADEIETILHALETNCRIYDVLDLPSEEEIEEEFWEAEPFDPETMID